jgi:hypothetical protein
MDPSTADQSQLRAGTKVESADGVNLGTVKEIQLRHYLIEKGLIFKHDLYVPYDAIANYDGETAWLNVTKAEVDASNWNESPMYDEIPGFAETVPSANPVNPDPLGGQPAPPGGTIIGDGQGTSVTKAETEGRSM